MTPHRQPPVRILVIGAGPASVTLHLPVLARLRDTGAVTLALVCDIQPDRAAAARRKFGFLEDSGNAIAALESDAIDAVYIFSSAQLHYEYGLRALRNGKHLFVEKPVAPSYAQALELAQAARANRCIAVGGHNRRFYRSLAAVRARAGKTRWRFAEAVFHKPEFGKPPSFGARTWLGANGIHALDALVFMMGGLPGLLTSLASEGSTGEAAEFSALMRWPGGEQGIFLCNNDAGSRREEYVFHGAGETYTVTEEGLSVHGNNSLTVTPLPSIGDGIAAEHDSFLQAITGGIEPPHRLEAIAPSLFLAELIEAGFSGPVRLPQGVLVRAATSRESTSGSILVTRSAEMQPALARLLPQYRLVSIDDVRASPVACPDVVAAILGRSSDPLSSDVLSKLPELMVVGVVGLSLARYAPEALLARDIALLNASDAYADSVAEFALGLAVLGRRRAFVSHEVMRAGGWGVQHRLSGATGAARRIAPVLRPAIRAIGLEPFFLRTWRAATRSEQSPGTLIAKPRDLRGAVVGLIGWGANARAFAERLGRAGARVLVYSEHASQEDIGASIARLASLDQVLAADVVSMHRGLTARTRHFLGAAELDKLRPGAVLINVARGALIEPNALLARLKRGDVFACLDTYDEEPPRASHPLRRLPNVFLTSHIAGGSPDMHAAAADEVVRKVAAFLQGRAATAISAQHLETMT